MLVNCNFKIHIMKLKEYLKNQFPADLARLKFQKPNSVIQNNPDSFNIDQYTIYFGGMNWKNIDQDIKHIDKEFYEHFFLCLFTITIIDLTIFSHFRDYYSIFRNKTRYPKFGWSGFGPHYENPKKLLDIPFQKSLLRIDKIDIEEYVQLFISETNSFLESNLNQIKTVDFFNSLLTDKDFQVGENENNTLTPLIINKLKENFGN
jgi:hypothetical protein